MTDHRHHWQRHPETPETWHCADCPETSPTCHTCSERPTGTSLLICPPCLRGEERVLDEITAALTHWEPTSRSLIRSPRYDADPVAHTRDPGRLPFGLSVLEEGPATIEDMLWPWVALWTETTGSVGSVSATDYLRGHLLWAAHNPHASQWQTYRKAVRQVRWHARRIAGLLPQKQPAPCVHCGGTVVRDWADEHHKPRPDGLSDVTRCTGCGLTWGDRSAWDYAVRYHVQAAHEAHPDALVTLTEARAVLREVPLLTMRSWVRRDRLAAELSDERETEHAAALARGESPEPPAVYHRRLPERGYDVRGDALYRLGDLAWYAERRVDMDRVGRPATRQEERAG